jgi:hypothetical protein
VRSREFFRLILISGTLRMFLKGFAGTVGSFIFSSVSGSKATSRTCSVIGTATELISMYLLSNSSYTFDLGVLALGFGKIAQHHHLRQQFFFLRREQ